MLKLQVLLVFGGQRLLTDETKTENLRAGDPQQQRSAQRQDQRVLSQAELHGVTRHDVRNYFFLERCLEIHAPSVVAASTVLICVGRLGLLGDHRDVTECKASACFR